MRIFSILLLVILFFSCSNECREPDLGACLGTSDNPYVGLWEIFKVSADRGDGVFEEFFTDSDQYLIFDNCDNVFTNGTFCTFAYTGSEYFSGDTATYHREENRIEHEECDRWYRFLKLEQDTLSVSYICSEPCIQLYVRS